jgi:hypothetical protein
MKKPDIMERKPLKCVSLAARVLAVAGEAAEYRADRGES